MSLQQIQADLGVAIPGRATAAATDEYAERLERVARPEHFRNAQGLKLSSIGLGTYLGDATDDADASYRSAIVRAIELGCNFLDTAINYRHQRAERCVGAALATACEGDTQRSEIVVSTKAGYLPFDGELPENPHAYLREQYRERLQLADDELVGGHCMAASFLRDQIAQSRANLGLETIDVFYLHNPEEQLRAIDRETFGRRLRAAMEVLEDSCRQGHIASYGLATWAGFRESAEHRQYLSLNEVVRWATEVGGPQHHFRFLQLPLNLTALEPFMLANQRHEGQWSTLLRVAKAHGIHVVTSAPLLQARIIGHLPQPIQEAFSPLTSEVQRTVQFVRSVPGVGTVLVGMSRPQHVEENLALAGIAPDSEAVERLFRRTPRSEGAASSSG
ncbi:MAG: aldo/keto reductase [Acidobacteriota bacterium]